MSLGLLQLLIPVYTVHIFLM